MDHKTILVRRAVEFHFGLRVVFGDNVPLTLLVYVS